MTEQKLEQFMKELEQKMETYTKETILRKDEASGLWYLQTFLSVYPDYSANVLVQSFVFELKEGFPQIEVLMILTNDVQEGTEEELEKAAGELNYISPAGAFGLRRNLNRFYFRNCWPIDEKKEIPQMVKDVETYYEVMMEAVQGGYAGLSRIWNGEIDYEQAVALLIWVLLTTPWKLLEQQKAGAEADKEGSSGSLAGIFENSKILMVLLFGCVPLNIALMYVVSFIPSYMSSIGQSAAAVSYVYLINGLAGMYLGVAVLKIVRKKSLYLSASAALVLAAVGMLSLLISKNLGVIMLSAGILGLFDGFGTPSITSYFTSMFEDQSNKAGMMTIFNIVGSAVQIVCPMLYGMLIQTDGKMTYLAVFGMAYLFMAVLFVITCRPERKPVLNG